MNDELKRSSHGLIDILSWHLCGEIEENLETAGSPAKIQTEAS
jgi:hypothetical protein